MTVSERDISENYIQRAVFQHLRTRGAPGVFAFHPKNASADMRGRGRGIHVGLGVEPGVPDIIVIKKDPRSLVTDVYALELKRLVRRDKKMTPHEIAQEKTRARMALCGVITGIAFGLDEAIEQLEAWGLLRGTTS